jgi:transcriptional regulator with XRE-family HTH domain
MHRRNVTGRRVAYLRSEQNLSQDMLTARLQCQGMKITREVLANMECGRTVITDGDLQYFLKALHVPIRLFFSEDIRELDEKFAHHRAARLNPRCPDGKN